MSWPPILTTEQLQGAERYLAVNLTPSFNKGIAVEAAKELYALRRKPVPKIHWLPSPAVREFVNSWGVNIRNAPSVYITGAARRELSRFVIRALRQDRRLAEHRNWWLGISGFGTLPESLHIRDRARKLYFALAGIGAGLITEPKVVTRLWAWEQLYVSTHLAYLRKTDVYLCEPPKIERRDTLGRLHCAEGPAVQYCDGAAQYYWHGVIVPSFVIMKPRQITIFRILAQRNTEVRRVMMERYGFARYLKDAGATLLDTGKLGRLYDCRFPDDGRARFVLVKNATAEKDGTYKEYALQVPEYMWIADVAVAWTFGMTEFEYKHGLEQQT